MSALGVKRSFDIFASRPSHAEQQTIRSTACSPHRIQFLSQEQQQRAQGAHAHAQLPPFHPTYTSTSTSSSLSSDLSFDPHSNNGSIGSKRFRRTDSGDYDIVTVAGDDVHMETKSPPRDRDDSSSPTSTFTSTSTSASSSHYRSSSREPSAFVQAAAASSTEPFVNLDGLLQHYQATTRIKRQRSRDREEESRDDHDMPSSPLAKKVATQASMPSLHAHEACVTTTPATSISSSSSSSSSSATPASTSSNTSTPGVTSLAVFSSSPSTPSSTSSSRSTVPSPSQRLFTLTDVRKIVEEALAQQKEQLTQEYDHILNEKLREQFENFSSFNRDYISRQLSKNDFSYLS